MRDVKDTSISTLATQIHSKLLSLKSLISHLQEVQRYLENVVSGKLPLNHQILSQLQDVYNLTPNLNVEELAKSFSVKTNDMMLVIYLSSLIRSIIALHSLINNKLDNRERERKADLPLEPKAADKKTDDKKEDAKTTSDASASNTKPGNKH